jgi:class 3 adenylate cyclase
VAGRDVPSVLRGRPLGSYLLLGIACALVLLGGAVRIIMGYPVDFPFVFTYGGLLLLLTAGAVSLGTPRQAGNGRLILLLGMGLGLADLGSTLSDYGPAYFLSDVVAAVMFIVLGHLLLRWPNPRLQTRGQRLVLGAAYVVFPVMAIAANVTLDPAWFGPASATMWWLTLGANQELSDVLWLSLGVLFAAFAAALAVLIAARMRRAPRPERRELIPVGIATALLAVAGVGVPGYRFGWVPVDVANLGTLAILIVPLSFLAAVTVRRVQRALAVEALVAPGALADPTDVERALKRVMGDRQLSVALFSKEEARYVDADAAPAPDVAPGRTAIYVPSPDGSPLARLDVAQALADRPELTGTVAQAAVIGLDRARLRTELRLRAQDEQAVRRRLEEMTAEGERLSRLLPTGLPDKLRSDPGALGRVDEAVVTVLMSDVRGYSGIAERTPPAQLAQQLREHRAAMNAAILAEGGTVMQYVGDAVMAVFGAPFPQPHHADRAVHAAAAMHAAQGVLNEAWVQRSWAPFLLGIGLSTGPVATAILGGEDRYEYTIVGDTVNLAQRLESRARPPGTTLASAATIEALSGPSAPFELLPPFEVDGRSGTVTAYRLQSQVEDHVP